MDPIIKDEMTLENFQKYNYKSSCEDCSHFDSKDETCTFGFPTEPFLKRNQLKDIQELGKMAFCRAIEID